MLTYLFERMRTISYASNADTLLIRDKRASQPLVRVMLEGKDEGQIRELAQGLADLIKEKLA